MSKSEMRACAEKLESFRDEINILMNFIDDRCVVSGQDKTCAQEMLTKLKTRLNSEYRRISTIKGHDDLNDIEQAYYAPAVHQASASIRVKTNSTPGPSWVSDLYDARTDITHLLDQLYKQIGMHEQ